MGALRTKHGEKISMERSRGDKYLKIKIETESDGNSVEAQLLLKEAFYMLVGMEMQMVDLK